MSADGSITLNWAGDERRFRLAIGQLRELQESINRNRREHPIGPLSLWKLVTQGDAWPDDLREIIRLGLIGGGIKIELVPGLMKRYFDEQPLLRNVPVAAAIIGAALQGVEDDPAGKKPEGTPPGMATTFSSSPSSTDQEQQSGSPLDRSTTAHSGNSQLVSKGSIEPTVPRISPTR